MYQYHRSVLWEKFLSSLSVKKIAVQGNSQAEVSPHPPDNEEGEESKTMRLWCASQHLLLDLLHFV